MSSGATSQRTAVPAVVRLLGVVGRADGAGSGRRTARGARDGRLDQDRGTATARRRPALCLPLPGRPAADHLTNDRQAHRHRYGRHLGS